MAGAGYKLFSTGDVLSASDVNTYLQQQTVMVFASAAARTTALASVLAEGMVTYLKDTDVVEIYTGAAWVSLDDPNAIQNSIVDAKGDIITATADNTPARLAVGTNGQTLVADSSTATGLKWATVSSSPTYKGVRLTASSDPSIANATFVATTWDTETYDTDSFHSTSSNTSRITIPTGLGGYYNIEIAINWAAAGSGAFYTSIYKNGSLVSGTYGGYDTSQRSPMYYSSTLNLSAGDYIEAYVQQNSGGSKQYGSNANYTGMSYFQATYLGA